MLIKLHGKYKGALLNSSEYSSVVRKPLMFKTITVVTDIYNTLHDIFTYSYQTWPL